MVWSVIAYPYPITISVEGKTLTIRLYGDEHQAWAETTDGYTIVQNEQQQWCYARLGNYGQPIATQWQVGRANLENNSFCKFLDETPKHLFCPQPSSSPRVDENRHRRATTVTGERRVLIILMAFADLSFMKTQEEFYRLFNEENYHEDMAQGSVRDFYLSSSYGQLSLMSDVYGPYTATRNMAYYGQNSVSGDNHSLHAYDMFTEAIEHVAAEADLSQYDCDGDGFIDNVHIIFAGYGEEAGASANTIWSHEATFYRPYIVQDMKIDRYSCAPELRGNAGGNISRIGPHCHEIGHALGAMDFYDTDYSTNGEYVGTGMWDVMAAGSWNNDGITPADFNPYVKAYNFGWVSPKPLPLGDVDIAPSNTTHTAYYSLRSSQQGDYYLIDNRSQQGWGKGLPGQGLLLFHIHHDIVSADNDINVTAPQMCYVVCASSKNSQPDNNANSYGDINSAGCPYPGSSSNHIFDGSSTPRAFYWTGDVCGISLNDITLANDGHVWLHNKSTETGYTQPETQTLFTEGFEGDLMVTVLESNSRQWMVVENPENDTQLLNGPISHGGSHCLQLSARDQYFPESCALEFTCTADAEQGKLQLRGYFTSYGLRPRSTNTLRVGYCIDDEIDWVTTDVKPTARTGWQQFMVNIPAANSIRLKIDGTATIGSILAIDDLEVVQEIDHHDEAVITAHHTSVSGSSSAVYSLTGQRRQRFTSGLYIINNGTTTKKLYKK